MKLRVLAPVIGAAATALLASATPAAVVQFDLGVAYSGVAPEGPAPWLRATFDDGGGTGSVTLTLESRNLTDAEFVSDWRFNLDPSLNPESLVFTGPTKTGSFDDPVISSTGRDFTQAPGDGQFDILVAFETNGSKGGSRRFGDNGASAGDVAVYTINGIASLTASSFDFPSAPGGGAGPLRTAAHVQGIGRTTRTAGR